MRRFRSPFWRRWPRPVRWVVGVFLLILGVAGIFLPFLQGLLFLALGVAILRREIPVLDRIWRQAHRPWKARRAAPKPGKRPR